MKDFIGNCYEAAVRLVGTKKPTAQVVHGWIFSTKLHREIKHAWVEYEGKVWDFAGGRRVILAIPDYYVHGKARIGHRYTRDEAIKMARETGRTDWWTSEQREKILGRS